MTDRPTPEPPDESPDETPDGPTADEPTTDEPTTDGTTANPASSAATGAVPRPAAPGAAAARRARQLGGTRRPSPRPGPSADAADTDATATAPALTKPGKPAQPTATAAPKSSVGKAAARPRPRPTPAPVATTDDATDTADTADDAAPRPPRRGLLVGAALLTVLFLAAGVVFLVLSVTATPRVSAEETSRAVSAAKTDVALLTTYGYQTIDTDAAKAAEVITGQFKQQYLDAVETSVKPQLPTTQAVTTGQVDAAGLVSADARGRQVVVLVYGQQAVTNKEQTTPRIDAFQVRVTMQRVDGRWLVSALEQLGNNA